MVRIEPQAHPATRYTDADLEPVRAALAALSDGNYRPRARRAEDFRHGESAMLTQIGTLVDEVAAQLASLNSEVTQKATQVRDIAVVTTAVARGDLTRKVTVDAQGEMLELKQTVNTMVDQLSAFADEVTRVAREVGTEGRLGGQAHVRGVSGVWKDLTDNVNFMASNLTSQVRNIAQVTTAVADGDLGKKITVDAQGEILELKQTVNTMVDQLSAFADEVTRVAREVGTEGRLGGQAHVRGVSGVWKDLTDNVNFMASNLTSQVRNIAQVTTAVADGDLSKKIDVDARGEILELKTTINTMVDQLSAFADEVTRVAREVGTEGRLGGQAEVSDVSGTWQRLTESVNGLASNLTTQVRAIAAVASAVAEGDLTQSIAVRGARRGRRAQGQHQPDGGQPARDHQRQPPAGLAEHQPGPDLGPDAGPPRPAPGGPADHERADPADLGPVRRVLPVRPASGELRGRHGREPAEDEQEFTRIATYGFRRGGVSHFTLGEGLAGQAALERKRILIRDAPPGLPHRRLGARRGQPGRAWWCCRSPSRAGCWACSSSRRCTTSRTCTWRSSTSSCRRSASPSTRSWRTRAPRRCSSSRSG